MVAGAHQIAANLIAGAICLLPSYLPDLDRAHVVGHLHTPLDRGPADGARFRDLVDHQIALYERAGLDPEGACAGNRDLFTLDVCVSGENKDAAVVCHSALDRAVDVGLAP